MKNIVCAIAPMCMALNANAAGLRMIKIEMPHHESSAGISIWYSNGGGGDQTVVAKKGVF